jgi:hypothetical protein
MPKLGQMNLVIAILFLLLGPGLAHGQSPENHRSGFGELRATVVESLLSKIHPGARFQWDPDLRLEIDRKLAGSDLPWTHPHCNLGWKIRGSNGR